MIPTMYLRFEKRNVYFTQDGNNLAQTVKILQQWWSIHGAPPRQATEYAPHGLPGASMNMGEWRDVEIAKL